MIINRYLTKEVYSTLLATVIVLLIVFLSNQVVRYLQSAAAGHISSHVVALLIFLQLPHLLSLLLPLSLFLAILIAYGRLYADNEMTILSACGVSPWKLFGITLQFSGVIVVIVGILSLWIEPQVSRYTDAILANSGKAALELLMPNRFQSISDGKWVLYVNAASRDKKQLKEIFAAQQPPELEDSRTLPGTAFGAVIARGGYQTQDKVSGDSYLILTDGYRYEGVPGQKDFKVIKFSEYGVKLQRRTDSLQTSDNNLPTRELLQKHDGILAMTELQWRLSLPITAVILALLGLALSRVEPRRGRYAKLLPATIVYITYAQLIFLSRAWMKKGVLTPYLGLWWVHAVMLALAVALLIRQNNR